MHDNLHFLLPFYCSLLWQAWKEKVVQHLTGQIVRFIITEHALKCFRMFHDKIENMQSLQPFFKLLQARASVVNQTILAKCANNFIVFTEWYSCRPASLREIIDKVRYSLELIFVLTNMDLWQCINQWGWWIKMLCSTSSLYIQLILTEESQNSKLQTACWESYW